MRILICDDHAVFAESLAAVLERAGYEVLAVTHSPDEALAALTRHDIDVCVLDVRFPSGSIIGRLPALRAAAPDARTVLLSAETDAGLVRKALAAGVRGFAHKGVHIADICSALERVHEGEVVINHARVKAPPHAANPHAQAHQLARFLTQRERDVLCHLVWGQDTKALARSIGVTWSTARSHIQSVLSKLGVHSRLEAAAFAVRYGLISGDTGEWLLDPEEQQVGVST